MTAIYWIAHAWEEVKSDTIMKCFRSAGVLTNELDVVSVDESDPFSEINETVELTQLIERTVGSDSCPAREYIAGDDDLPVCDEMDNETWDQTFMETLLTDSGPTLPEDESDTEEDHDLLPPPPKFSNFNEAVVALEDVKHFLESRHCLTEAQSTETFD